MQTLTGKRWLVAFALLSMGGVAHAHTNGLPHMDFAAGLSHPFSGLDHILAMVAVGLWAAQLGGRALWLVPLTFVPVSYTHLDVYKRQWLRLYWTIRMNACTAPLAVS